MSLNYNLIDTIKLIELVIKNKMFISILISISILSIIFYINKKYLKWLILTINIVLLFGVCYYYLFDIISLNFNNPINNIYVYFLNTILFITIFSVLLFINKVSKIDFIFYYITLINIIYSLFITYYFKNYTIIVIGNIFPIIKFGNLLYVLYYIYVVLRRIIYVKKVFNKNR